MDHSFHNKGVLVLLFCLAASLVLACGTGLAQEQPDRILFDEKAHSVEGPFATAYQAHGGLAVLGYPITQSLYDPVDQRQVQYFQNGRLEIDPTDGQVRLSPLPLDMRRENETPRITPGEADARGIFYEPTGHSVIMALKDFYLLYGGPEVFGYPISEVISKDDGLRVQYFERAIMEWHPEFADGHRVQLAQVGEILFYLSGLDRKYLEGMADIDVQVTDIHLTAAVQEPFIHPDDEEQVVYVFAGDQLGRPVEQARIQIDLQGGAIKTWSDYQFTDGNGTAVFVIQTDSLQAGDMIAVRVSATYKQTAGSTGTAFRVWW